MVGGLAGLADCCFFVVVAAGCLDIFSAGFGDVDDDAADDEPVTKIGSEIEAGRVPLRTSFNSSLMSSSDLAFSCMLFVVPSSDGSVVGTRKVRQRSQSVELIGSRRS